MLYHPVLFDFGHFAMAFFCKKAQRKFPVLFVMMF